MNQGMQMKGNERSVSACRRVGVSACRRVGVSAKGRKGVWATTSDLETPEGLKDEEGTQKGCKHAAC
jgi:hypothetical protein